MIRIPLQTVPDPGAGRSTLVRRGDGTLVFDGDYDGPAYTCGACGAELIRGVRGEYIIDLVLVCNACDACNLSPAADTSGIAMTTCERPVTFPVGRYELTGSITVHDRWVMGSERALRSAPVRDAVQEHP